ncbi:hypothetical protein Glove_109g234 [Diversispora epigaea]|uniref:Uncharacterized protein n=1 Tax=Diversispora epigaea TaxID=1348612 RepID=A0A397JB35_9GLOM|nr:hypothetical protein Glove_109g234 [Diversispora epigaea]
MKRCDLETMGNNITSAIKDIAGISVTHIEPNLHKGKSLNTKILKETKWYWPSDGEHAGNIKGRAVPNIENWILFYNNTYDISDEFPLSSGWASKEVQKKRWWKTNKKRISAILEQYFFNKKCRQDIREIESSEIPKLTIIQGCISHYVAQLRKKSTQTVLNEI